MEENVKGGRVTFERIDKKMAEEGCALCGEDNGTAWEAVQR